MKILWIVNSILDAVSEHLYNKKGNGVWMDALLGSFKQQAEYQIVVATTARVNEIVKIVDSGVSYYVLPNQPPTLYDENKQENINAWKMLLDNENPDLIHVFGTEFTHGLCALRIAKNIPSVIHMQGVLASIARFYCAGISHKELRKNVTLRDLIKQDGILQQQKKYYKSSCKEAEMIRLSGRIISENEWCAAYAQAIFPAVKIFTRAESLNQVFYEHEWNLNNIERHSILCTASGYTIKGLHMVFHAVALLKEKYPDIKVYVPGTPQVSDGSVCANLRKRGYTRYIEKLQKQLELEEQIVWLGQISQKELAKKNENSHVFVMSSAVENHSNSLKEAMMVGAPSIASYVGGIPEYVQHNTNGFLYRFEEYEVMALYISKIFDNDDLAIRLSKNARKSMLQLHDREDVYNKTLMIYQSILQEDE